MTAERGNISLWPVLVLENIKMVEKYFFVADPLFRSDQIPPGLTNPILHFSQVSLMIGVQDF